MKVNNNNHHSYPVSTLSLDSDSEQERTPRTNATIPSVAQALMPSTICASFADIVKLLDDHAVNSDGIAVYQVAYQVGVNNISHIGFVFLRLSGIFWLRTVICFSSISWRS